MRRLITLALLATLACAPTPPDIFVFEELSPTLSTDPDSGHLVLLPSPTCLAKIVEATCGHGVSIVSGQEIFVGERPPNFYKGKPWSMLKAQSVYMPALESYAPLATYVINSCKKAGCSAEVDKFKVKLGSLSTLSKY